MIKQFYRDSEASNAGLAFGSLLPKIQERVQLSRNGWAATDTVGPSTLADSPDLDEPDGSFRNRNATVDRVLQVSLNNHNE